MTEGIRKLVYDLLNRFLKIFSLPGIRKGFAGALVGRTFQEREMKTLAATTLRV